MADRRIDWSYFLDPRNFVQGNKKSQQSMTQTEKVMGKLKKSLGTLGLAFGAAAALDWAKDALNLAKAAEEVDSKFQAVFKTGLGLTKWLEEWGDLAGVTTTEAKDLAATFGNLAQAQGISEAETEKLTKQVATLAGDMASFNNAEPSAVFNDLNKALLTTEREGLKKYGIAVTESEVKTRAAALAAKDGRTEVTKADRAYASYAIAVEQAGQAVGDLERTQDSAANTERRLRAQIKETQEEIGKELLPAYAELLKVLDRVSPATKGVTRALDANTAVLDKNKSGWDKFLDTLTVALPPLWAVRTGIENLTGAEEDNTDALARHMEAMADFNDELRNTKRAQEIADISEPYRLMALHLSDAVRHHQELNAAANNFDVHKIITAQREFLELRAILGSLAGQSIDEALTAFYRTNPGTNIFG